MGKRRKCYPKIMMAFVVILLGGCYYGKLLLPVFTNYQGAAVSDQQIAILTHGLPCSSSTPGFKRWLPCVKKITRENQALVYDVNEQKEAAYTFKLVPGTYVIAYSYQSACCPHRFPTVSHVDTVGLKAGHTYQVAGRECFGGIDSLLSSICRQRERNPSIRVWIEDRTTGQVVAGEQ